MKGVFDIFSGVIKLFFEIKILFWAIGYFGWQIATLYALYVSYHHSYEYCFLFFILFAFSGWLNHNLLKNTIHDLRPANPIPFLDSDEFMKRTNGMPSGHAQQTAFALTVAYKITNKYLYESMALLILTVVQRYVYRNHTIPQLIAGSVLGFILGHIGVFIMDYIEKHQFEYLHKGSELLNNSKKIDSMDSVVAIDH